MANISFAIRIEGLDQLVADSKRAGDQAHNLLYQAMVKSTTVVQEDAKRVAPGRFKNQTGNLRRSIFRRVESALRGVVGVATSAPYGAGVEFGTRPHTIYPKNGRYLAFKAASGQMVFARKINHPGSRPYPYMQPAFHDNLKTILDIYAEVGRRLVNMMAGK